MKYKTCQHCGASNRGADKKCYGCGTGFDAPAKAPSAADAAALAGPGAERTQSEALKEVGHSRMVAFLAISLSSMLGTGLGFGISLLETELPFFLEEVIIGVLCAVAAAFCIGKFQEMPEGLLYARLGPAAGFGALVGMCLFAIWWSFDPSAGLPVIGGIAGLCAGIPVAVSFGLAGGESRPLGQLEFLNVLMSMGIGFGIGILCCLEYGDFYWVPGIAGILALAPTFLGGRINLNELLAMLPSSRYDNDW